MFGYVLVVINFAFACVAVNAWNDAPHAYPDHVLAHAHGPDPDHDVHDPKSDTVPFPRNTV